jgi:hypothetical protein
MKLRSIGYGSTGNEEDHYLFGRYKLSQMTLLKDEGVLYGYIMVFRGLRNGKVKWIGGLTSGRVG